ncbi:MAG: peptidylprolyl isomerase [Bacteroidales bacterium]|nr:peptidylprolyl isomerase [Bacteroidales bacterium]
MKRYLTLAVLVVLAVSCGGRRGQDGDGTQEDSLATAVQEKPKDRPKSNAKSTPDDSLAALKQKFPEEPIFDILTSMGTIRVKLYKDTPKHRANFIRLALTHYYDGLLFHRVVEDFVIQGGDPFTRDSTRLEEWGEGGPGYTIDPEIVPEHTHKKGALAAARRGNYANPMKESSGSQFYLVQNADNCKHLDGEYTVFGETVGGLNVIDRIAALRVDRYNRPLRRVVIMRISPNEQLNKRALEEEERAREELENPVPTQEEAKPDEKKEGEIITLQVQETVDSSVLRGRKLKHRE